MNRYYALSDDQRKELVAIELSIKEKAIELAEDVKRVVAMFDGKQLNKRLQTALQKIDDRLYVYNEYNSFNIKYIERDNRYIKTRSGVAYVNNNEVYISSTAKSNAYGDSSITDDNEIIASAVMASIDKNVDYLTKEIAEAREQMNFIEDYRKDKQRITQAIENQNNINYMVRTYFDLEINR